MTNDYDVESNDIIIMTEEDAQRARKNTLANYSAEHLRWAQVTGSEALHEKLARWTLESVDSELLFGISREEALEHACSRAVCGVKADIEHNNKEQ